MLKRAAGNKKALNRMVTAPRNTERAIQLAFYHIGKDHTDELSRQMLKKDKTGRIYIIRGRRHRASAPGQTAANRSGTMRRARKYRLRGSDQLEFGIEGAKYAAFLENGTRRIAPRPSLGNTVKALQKNTTVAFERALENKLT